MPYFRYIAVMMLFSLVFPAACGSGRNRVMQDPVASSGTSSEDVWYQYGGARVAYTTVARPRQLHTGYGSVLDPALHGQAPATTKTASKAPAKRSAKPKPAAAPPRDPNCPPCPPADAANTPPPAPSPQASPASPLPAQSAVSPAPPVPAAGVPGAAAVAAPPPPRISLPAMPPPAAPNAPAR
jgi:hypothetical protein